MDLELVVYEVLLEECCELLNLLLLLLLPLEQWQGFYLPEVSEDETTTISLIIPFSSSI